MNKERIRGIYKITNLINNKVYIGESLDIYRRWDEHRDDLNNNSHHSYKLQSDWNEFRQDNFKFEIISILDEDISNFIGEYILIVYEDKYIKQYDSISNGYNVEETLEKVLAGEKIIFNKNKDKSMLNSCMIKINEFKEFIDENRQIRKNKIYNSKELAKLLNICIDDLKEKLINKNIIVNKRKGYRVYDCKFILSENYIDNEDIFQQGDSIHSLRFTKNGLDMVCNILIK
jgi:group I intron endonuclease